MFSKFLHSTLRRMTQVPVMARLPVGSPSRSFGNFVPRNQYHQPFPDRLKIGYAMRVYWETIPLFVCTGISIALVVAATIYAVRNKTEVVYTTRNRAAICRTMDLREPTVHKVITINHVTKPWPRMQDVLDKMKAAEKRALSRAETCSVP